VSTLLLAGCTQGAQDHSPETIASAEPSETLVIAGTPSITPTPVATLEETESCDGVGRAPKKGQITLIENDRLRAYSPEGSATCLADISESGTGIRGGLGGSVVAPSWNGPADRVIVGDRALSEDGSVSRQLTGNKFANTVWSRPSGTSVIWITKEGHLMKRSSFGGKAVDISFLARHDDIAYHPAGTHIVTSGLKKNGDYGLFLATNIGTETKLIAKGEDARFIDNLSFGEDGESLYYEARHGPQNWHLHRMQIGAEASLETLSKQERSFEYVVSPTDPFQVAWFTPGDCTAGEPGTFKAPGLDLQIPEEMKAGNIHPVGWLPSQRLVARVATTGCSTAQPGEVYVLSRDAPVLVADENYGNVSVRVKMPKPPPPPGDKQEVVA
jgi:hypothetical protein